MRIETEKLIETYSDNVFAAAFSVCRNSADADDIVQEVFIQYHSQRKDFESEQHIRAWLMRVAINRAKNVNRAFWRRASVPLEEYTDALEFPSPEAGELFETVMHLPEKCRTVMHLFYYEDASVREISDILGISEGAVRVRLSRGRELLRKSLKEEWADDE